MHVLIADQKTKYGPPEQFQTIESFECAKLLNDLRDFFHGGFIFGCARRAHQLSEIFLWNLSPFSLSIEPLNDVGEPIVLGSNQSMPGHLETSDIREVHR
jgi:hypothetical protein